MALDFGKVAFSVSFDPTFAFPVDARSYFESYDAAVVAAASAKEAGSSESVYYYGQTLVVVENNKATFYIIQPDNTLSTINGSSEESTLTLDENQFRFNDDGKLSLVGYEDASSGQVLTLGSDGKLIWSNPIDTYTKTEIDTKIAAAGHLKRVIVKDKDEIINNYFDKDDYDTYIFMISKFTDDSDKYDEYIIIDIDGLKTIERVGTWEVDLTKYATKEELNSKVDKHDNDRLITETEAAKLTSIVDLIKSVDDNRFSVNENGKLSFKDLIINDIGGLIEALKKKVDIVDGSRLITSKEAEILNKLVMDDNGEVGISGTISAANVKGLYDLIYRVVVGSGNEIFDEEEKSLLGIEAGAQKNYINSVDETQLLVKDKKLSIKSISIDTVVDLEKILNNKANASAITEINTSISNIENLLNTKYQAHETRIAALEGRLIWHSLVDIEES